MLEFLALKTEAFGLDISDLSVKIAKLEKRGGILGLSSFGEAEIKPGAVEEGEVKDEDVLAKAIEGVTARAKGKKIKTKYVVCSLPEEKAFLQVIQVPKMKEEQLRGAVRFESENYIPLPIEEVYLDFQIVQPLYNHLDHTDVLIAALPKKTVDPYVASIKKAGFIPLVLEVESQAISRAIIKKEVSPFPALIIDLGATRTSFIIFSGCSLRFTSSIPISSRHFTEAIIRNLKKDPVEAEKLKIKYGVGTNQTKEGKQTLESLIPALTDLIEQIKIHLSYYQTHAFHEHLPARNVVSAAGWHPNGKGVSKIFLCGGGANLKGLARILSLELKIPVELGNPWINILPEPLREVPDLPYEKSLGYTTALGLALRGIKEK